MLHWTVRSIARSKEVRAVAREHDLELLVVLVNYPGKLERLQRSCSNQEDGSATSTSKIRTLSNTYALRPVRVRDIQLDCQMII
jgi:hypothetical protein